MYSSHYEKKLCYACKEAIKLQMQTVCTHKKYINSTGTNLCLAPALSIINCLVKLKYPCHTHAHTLDCQVM